MKKYISLLFSVLFVATIFAQQTPQYTHYIFNHFAINPAVAGSKKCMDIRMGYRTQWQGFEGAPKTAIASLNGPMGVKNKSSFKTKHGIGGLIENDRTDPLGRTTMQLAYSYHFPITRERFASIGMFAGFTQFSFDASQLAVENPADPAIISSKNVFVLPEFNPGIWVYSDKSFFGFSVMHLTSNRIKDVGLDTRFKPHFYMTYGKALKVGKELQFRPSVLIKKTTASPLALDINGLLDIRDVVTIGLSYRNTDAVSGLVKFKFLRYFSIAYAYDYTTSRINLSSSNTHEIILGALSCPRPSGGKGYVPCSAYD